MAFRNIAITLGLTAATALLAACASQPATPASAPVATAAPAPAATTEKDNAAGLEKKFQDAARSYKVVQKDGKTLYCKREKVLGSTIPTMQCITESQLRNEVENADELRQRMRNRAGGCVQTGGCSSGG